MQKILDRFCGDEEIKNGLLLVDMPTGAGKTYNVLEYIYKNYEQLASNGHKIIFVTTLKKNLPIEDLRKRFEKDKKLEQFKKDVLFIDSNVDCLIENFDRVEKKMPPEFIDYDLFKKINEEIKIIKDYEKTQNKATKNTETQDELFSGYVKMAKDSLRTVHERQLREIIENKINYDENKKRRSKLEKKKYIALTNSWIADLYPAIRTDEAKIIFMSLDKFLVRNSTIIEPSYVMANAPFIKGALVFLDEFDACKETILKSNIDNALKDKISMLQLFRIISKGVATKFTRSLTKESDELKEELKKDGCKKKTPLQIIDSFINEVKVLNNDFHLELFHKLKTEQAKSSNFIFHDIKYHNILSEKDKDLLVSVDNEEQVNRISLKERDSNINDDDHRIYGLLKRVKGFIDYFARGVNYIALNYKSRKQKVYFDYSHESAIRTVLSEFGIEGTYANYILSIILNQKRVSTQELNNDLDTTVFQKGFRYYSILDGDDFDTVSRVDLFDFNESPEKFLLKLVLKAKVVGISATALNESATGNFYIDYLTEKLGKDFYKINSQEQKRLKEFFEDSCCGYEGKVNIIPKEICVNENDIFKGLKEIFLDEEVASKWKQDLEILSNDKYIQTRYIKILYSMKAFFEDDSLKSFLCLTSKKADNSYQLKSEFLYNTFIELKRIYASNLKCYYKVLDGDLITFEYKKEQIKKWLEEGNKVFVMSTYATVGAGQNLQYRVPNELKGSLVDVSKVNYNTEEKDYDGIYLDKPTNIFVNLNRATGVTEELAKYLYDIQFLLASGELSMDEADSYIKSGFATVYLGVKNYKPIPETRSIELHYCRNIIQAIGRICRTSNKNKNILICYDSKIKELLSKRKAYFKDKMINPEFQKLLDKIKDEEYIDDFMQESINKAEQLSTSNHRDITSILSRASSNQQWSFPQMEDWKKRREIVLAAPTIQENSEYKQYSLYVKLPTVSNIYWYEQDGDYKDTKISFNKKLSGEVSQDACQLDKLMKFSDFYNYFKECGYATEFAKSQYMLSPIMFNNIYKGALGEVIGKFIFEKYILGMSEQKLCEIEDPTKFEKFDFCINDTCYIDFKFWGEYSIASRSLDIQKIKEKLDLCKGTKAIVANILKADIGDMNINQVSENILLVPYLYDFENEKKPIPMKWFERIRKFINE